MLLNTPAHTDNRLLAISDIHGCQEELLLLLKEAAYNPAKDRLILLGDYINADDRETWSTLLVIRQLVARGAHALTGNQELRLLASDSNARLLEPSIKNWLQELPFYHLEAPYLFVHAGIRPGVPLLGQSRQDLTEIRDAFIHNNLAEDDDCKPYTIIFGHTPTFKLKAMPGRIWHGHSKIGIDTGAKHGYRLTLLDLSSQASYSCSTAPGARCSDLRAERLSLDK
ncbi:serine/threonine protein phosphatase 1 [Paenibacillus endophyticus]|uniref:Serine/threonine protein phosphatase 1 n=1 Tax=Paenibacillus endophyticus TaxID=1294268 RepID=A0A7W5G986_9BACL|nr:metallophosphoesterase [Paenibacillus endophyticus]MBB3150702.1 serine/threonine protein phosphatase 1 [Paenibacillus endophyticus]